MHGNPMDIFDEMDEMFDRLFSRMDHRMGQGPAYGNGCRVLIRDDDGEMEPMETGPARATGFEPTADVQRIGNEVKVVTDLPGITTDSLRLGIRNGTLIIDAGDADCHYHTTAALPPVETGSMTHTLKNGVLEVTFRAGSC